MIIGIAARFIRSVAAHPKELKNEFFRRRLLNAGKMGVDSSYVSLLMNRTH